MATPQLRSLNTWVQYTALAAALLGLPVLAASHGSKAVTRPAALPPMPRLEVLRAEPHMNDTVTTSPNAIKLWFSESAVPATTSIRVTGPAAHVVALGAVVIDSDPQAPTVAQVNETLAPGQYTVQWNGIADGGHASSGRFTFTVRSVSHGPPPP